MSDVTLRADVAALAGAGDRQVGSAGHAAAKRYLTGRLAGLGLEPYAADYSLPYAPALGLSNLVAVVPGRDRGLAPVVVGAHHDTVPGTPGADDNAAAVAAALVVAERLVTRPAERDVVVALFDAEEPPYFQGPYMGSTAFYRRQRHGPVHAAVVMDLVGHATPIPGAADLLVVTGMESDPALGGVVRGAAGSPLSLVTVPNRHVGDMSDHHVFRLERVPYLFLTCGRWEHYHAPTDTPGRLDYRKLAHVTNVVETLVRGVAATELAGPWEDHDTTDADLASVRAALGPAAAALGIELRTDADLGRLVKALMRGTGV